MTLGNELASYDATGQAELVRRRELTATELVEAAITATEALNPVVNAVVTPMFDRALDEARMHPRGPFAGVPYLLKDLLVEAAGSRFTEGSLFLRDNVSRFDSELVVRLRRAGLVILGKTSTPEFGMAPTCEAKLFGPTRNPWDVSRSTSGSSGGSAAAVAARIVPMAHGNDLGGSLRYPASACGVFGLKPTRARNPLGPEYGDVLNGWAVEHAVTRTVRDSAALLDATAGPSPGDPYAAPPPARPYAAEVGVDPGRLRIGFSPRTTDGNPGHPDCVAALDDAVGVCAALGHDMVETDLPGLTPEVGTAIGTMYNAATAWILSYWIRRTGGSQPRMSSIHSPMPSGRKAGGSARLTTSSQRRTCSPSAARWRVSSLASTCGSPQRWQPLPCRSGRSSPHRSNPCGRLNAEALRSPTPGSSPTSPATRQCRSPCGGTATGCPSAPTSSAASARSTPSSGSPPNSKLRAHGRSEHPR